MKACFGVQYLAYISRFFEVFGESKPVKGFAFLPLAFLWISLFIPLDAFVINGKASMASMMAIITARGDASENGMRAWATSVIIAMTILSASTVAIRVISRRIRRQKLWWDDWLCITSMVSTTLQYQFTCPKNGFQRYLRTHVLNIVSLWRSSSGISALLPSSSSK